MRLFKMNMIRGNYKIKDPETYSGYDQADLEGARRSMKDLGGIERHTPQGRRTFFRGRGEEAGKFL